MFISYKKFNHVVNAILKYLSTNGFDNTKSITEKKLLDSNLVSISSDAKEIRMLLLNKKVNKIFTAIKIVFYHYDEYNPVWENNKGDKAKLLTYRRKDRWKEFKQLFNI